MNFKLTRRQVALHDPNNNVLIIIDNMVYDVSNFNHPGGNQLLDANAGKDVSTEFYTVQHSELAFDYMKQMLVAEIADNDKRDYFSYRSSSDDILRQRHNNQSLLRTFCEYYMSMAIVILLAYGLYTIIPYFRG